LYITGFENGDDSLEKRFTVAHDATIIEEDGLETQIAPRDVQFQSASLGRRMMTNFAGPMNNFILSFILFTIVAFMLGGSYKPDNSSTIGGVVQDGVAQKAGIKAGEKIIEANGKKIETFNELSEVITPNVGKKVTLVVEDSNKKTRNVDVTPVESAEGTKQGIIGIQSGTVFTELSFFEKIKYGITETFANSLMIFKALGNLVTDFSLNKLGGPVMIFKASEAVSNSGFIAILSFTAMLSVNLGIMNLVPIPGLDGGKLALNIFEGVRGKPLSQEKEVMITMIGVGILLLLMIAVTWNDIQRFFIR
jgi:regulator of sigma E protease